MAKLTTKNFKLHHVRQFIESITEPSNTVYYVFAGNPGSTSFSRIEPVDSGTDPRIVEATSDMTQRVYDLMTHAKRVTASDVAPMVRRINWETGTVYDQYDSNSDLGEKNYFVVSQSGNQNNYYVFKCLYNNYGAVSTEQPQFSETSADDPYYETSDGYVWKYLYTINPYTFNKFATYEFIPVIEDPDVTAAAQAGAIDIIRVDYPGSYYDNWYIGQFTPGDVGYGGVSKQIRLNSPSPKISNITTISGDGTTITVTTQDPHGYLGGATVAIKGTGTEYDGTYTNITILSSTSFSFLNQKNYGSIATGTTELYISSSPYTSYSDSFYKNCIIKITSGNGRGQYRIIDSYDGNERIATLEYEFDVDQDDLELATYEIYPQAIVTPDDRQTNTAIARAIVNPAAANSISYIEVLEKGFNQIYATANVYANEIVRNSNAITEAQLTVIIPPKNGHGFDVASELGCDRLGVSVKFSNNENGTISTDNSFRTIGLLKDPKYFKVRLGYDVNEINGSFLDNERVLQLDKTYLGGSVGVDSSNLQIYSTGTFSGLQITYGAAADGTPTKSNDTGQPKYYELSFNNSDVIKIGNVAIEATANGEVFGANNWMVEGPDIVAAGFGFSDPYSPVVRVQNTVGGYIRYLSSNNIIEVANGINSTANGKNYAVGNYFKVDTPYLQDANVVITEVDGNGGITGIQIVNAGRVYGNEIAAVDITNAGGASDYYTNNDVVTFDAPYFGSDTATANIIANSTGYVVGINFTNRGSGYTTIPTITLANSSSGGSATATAIIASKGTTYAAYTTGDIRAFGGEITNVVIDTAGADIYDSTRDIIVIESPTTDGHANVTFTNTATGNLESIVTIAGNNYGYTLSNTNIITVANSTSGYTRYFNTSGIISEYVLVEANPNTSIDETAVVTSWVSANGGNYDSTMVESITILDGGIGYNSTLNNTLTITPPGSGTTTEATFTNNEIGKIITVTIQDPGTGYTALPTISANLVANGIGASFSTKLSNTLTIIPNALDSAYGAVVYFTNTAGGNVATISVGNTGFGYLNTPTAIIVDANTAHDHVGTNTATFTVPLAGGTDIYTSTDTILATGPDASPNSTADLTVVSSEITEIDVTNSGAGFYPNVIPEYYIANSTSGNIRYLSSLTGTTIVRDLDAPVTDSTGLFASTNTDVLYIDGIYETSTANVMVNGSGNIQEFILNNSGSGIPDHNSMVLKVLDTANSNIRRLNDTIVGTISIAAGGKGYNNNHILIVDSGPGTVNASFKVITNGDGELTGFTAIDRGSGQKPAYISSAKIVNGGSGYDSTGDTWTVAGGGGTAGTITFANTGSGVIDKVYITNSGVNYNCAPSLYFSSTSGTNASVQLEVIKPYRLYLYTDSSLNTIAQSTDGSCYELDVNMINTPTVYANLAYATVATANVVAPAQLDVYKAESANLFFVAQTAPYHEITLTGQYTSFSSSIDADDYIFLQSASGQTDLLQVDNVSNASHLTVKTYPNFTSQGSAISVVRINAEGLVLDKGADYIDVANVVGSFTIGNTASGFDSDASFTINSVKYNDIEKTDLVINQLFAYKYSGLTGTFTEDDTIIASDPNTGGIGKAKFHSYDSVTSQIFLTEPTMVLKSGEVYTNGSGAIFTVASGSDIKYEGDLVRGSGDIIYIEDLDDEINRANNQSETIKIIVEF